MNIFDPDLSQNFLYLQTDCFHHIYHSYVPITNATSLYFRGKIGMSWRVYQINQVVLITWVDEGQVWTDLKLVSDLHLHLSLDSLTLA